MKPKLLALFLLISVGVSAQTKQIEYYNKDLDLKEVFTISDSVKNIKEGAFKQFPGPGSGNSTEGYYHNNLKDGLWKYYYRDLLVAEGYYTADKKVGIWVGYTRGFERLKYDFTKQELLAYIPATIDTVQKFKALISSADTVFDRKPIYINGMVNFANNLLRGVHYPALARETNKQGEVIIAFTINEEGNTNNFVAKTNLGYGLENEALRIMKQNNGVWVPAILKGKPVAVECEVAILFELIPPADRPHKPNQIVIKANAVGH